MCDMTNSNVWRESFDCTMVVPFMLLQHTTPRCNTLQHAATRCNTLQHIAAAHCHTRLHDGGALCVAACTLQLIRAWHDSFKYVTLLDSYVWLSFTCDTWLIHMWHMTHSHVTHDSFTCDTWLIHMCDDTHALAWCDSCCSHSPPASCMWHPDVFVWMCMTWLIHMCDMTHSYVWHDSFICVTWLIHMCDMTYSYVWHDSFTCETWLINICDITSSYVFVVKGFNGCDTTIHVCDMTHLFVRESLHNKQTPDMRFRIKGFKSLEFRVQGLGFVLNE